MVRKVTVRECIEARNGIEGIQQPGRRGPNGEVYPAVIIPGIKGNLPANLSYKLGRLSTDLKPIIQEYQKAAEELRKKYSEDEIKEKYLIEKEVGDKIQKIVDPARQTEYQKEVNELREAYQKEINKLLDIEEERDFYWVFLDDFRDPDKLDQWLKVDSESLRLITPFLIEEKEEETKPKKKG